MQLTFAQLAPMVGTKEKLFEVYVSILLKNAFPTLFLTAEAQVSHRLFAAAMNFLGTLESHGEFNEIEFYNSIQDLVFTTVFRLQKSAWENAWLYDCHLWYTYVKC